MPSLLRQLKSSPNLVECQLSFMCNRSKGSITRKLSLEAFATWVMTFCNSFNKVLHYSGFLLMPEWVDLQNSSSSLNCHVYALLVIFPSNWKSEWLFLRLGVKHNPVTFKFDLEVLNLWLRSSAQLELERASCLRTRILICLAWQPPCVLSCCKILVKVKRIACGLFAVNEHLFVHSRCDLRTLF